jgi:hypothetical protein
LTKRRKRIPKKELFNIQKRILILIFNENEKRLNKNKVYHKIAEIGKEEGQTGLRYKQNILDSIDALKEMELVNIYEEGAQKDNVVLTLTGMELSQLIKTIEYYITSYFNLINFLYEKVLFVLGRDLPFIGKNLENINYQDQDKDFYKEVNEMSDRLIQKGWNHNELLLYNEIRTNLIDLKVVCDTNFINMLLPRYSEIIRLNGNKCPLFLKFLNFLIKEPLEKKTNFILENYENEIYGYSNIRIIPAENARGTITLHENTGGHHPYFMYLYRIFYDNIITLTAIEEVKEMVSSYLELLDNPAIGSFEIEYMESLIKYYEDSLKNATEPNMSIIKRYKIELKIKTTKILLNAIMDYYNKRDNKPYCLFLPSKKFPHTIVSSS